jgi:hypothetical protein
MNFRVNNYNQCTFNKRVDDISGALKRELFKVDRHLNQIWGEDSMKDDVGYNYLEMDYD